MVHINFVSGLFVVVIASTGVLALVPWGARGLYKAPAIEHKARPPTMGGEPPRAIKHLAVIGRDDEKLQYRDGDQAGYFSASQGVEQAGF